MKITAALKGLITGSCMVAVFLLVYAFRGDGERYLQYLVYAIYVAGITWTLLAYRNSTNWTGRFADKFNQGFKCFVVVTLCMALFYGVFNYFHPEFATETAQAYKEQLQLEKSKLPAEIEEAVAAFKKQYTLKLVSGAIFGYLILGAIFTALLSALIHKRN